MFPTQGTNEFPQKNISQFDLTIWPAITNIYTYINIHTNISMIENLYCLLKGLKSSEIFLIVEDKN